MIFRYYVDKRANRSYYILRLASKECLEEWKAIVEKMSGDAQNYADILRGFFAGEGNIKTGAHSCRTIRISQKERVNFLEDILDYFKIKYTFSASNRMYNITGRDSWFKFARLGIADLHEIKMKKFYEAYNSYKQWHYSKNYIKNRLLSLLTEPKTSAELAKKFERSQARLQDVLIELKKGRKVKSFRVGSMNYWLLSTSNKILISNKKRMITRCLSRPLRTCDIANKLSR